mgnify:CR=1 FL=1
MMCLDVFLVFLVFGDSLGFLDLWINRFHQIWKIFGCYFLTCCSSFSFWWSNYAEIVGPMLLDVLLCFIHSIFSLEFQFV